MEDEVDAAGPPKDDLGVLGLQCHENEGEEKDLYWIGGVIGCFSSVFSLFKADDNKPQIEDEWDVPFESITDLVYLGSGAQGVVFSGNFRGEIVAVKKLRDKSETNFTHLRKLNHENIVRFKAVCTTPPSYCVIMEFCQYGPLYNFLHSGVTFAPKQILKWAKEVAQGMAYLHSHKIIHRDLKSPNILVADNLVVKVSDFGTSREWNDVSAIMSFTGTVAWMAPEIIRHEPCSERVDVWSYGVVLWELLTQEVPYKSLEAHAIMWGVGTDSISLLVPSTCPESIQLLLSQCWSRVPKTRPPFKIIVAHLEIAGEELKTIRWNNFGATQASWRKEVETSGENMYIRTDRSVTAVEPSEWQLRCEELRRARKIYEEQLALTSDIYMEVCAVRLQLEQRENYVAERERALKACKCISGFRKTVPRYQHQTSSSSEYIKPLRALGQALKDKNINQFHRKPKKTVAPIICEPVKVVVSQKPEKHDSEVIVNVKDVETAWDCSPDDSVGNNNRPAVQKDTFVERNGNVALSNSAAIAAVHENENYIPELAQV